MSAGGDVDPQVNTTSHAMERRQAGENHKQVTTEKREKTQKEWEILSAPNRPWKTFLTVDSDSSVPAAFTSWQICALLVIGLFLRT